MKSYYTSPEDIALKLSLNSCIWDGGGWIQSNISTNKISALHFGQLITNPEASYFNFHVLNLLLECY